MLSTSCRELAHQAVRWSPERNRIETDSILALRFFMLAFQAEKLESALQAAMARESDRRAIEAYLARKGRGKPLGLETRPIYAARPAPINSRWASALAVSGD